MAKGAEIEVHREAVDPLADGHFGGVPVQEVLREFLNIADVAKGDRVPKP